MTAVKHPRAIPELTAEPGGRSVESGIRACGVVMVDAAEVMRKNAAPAGFEGDPAEMSNHAMTATAGDLETATAALRVGLAAVDAYCDRMDTLRKDRSDLVTRRHTLQTRATELEGKKDADAGAVERHNGRVTTFDGDVKTWDDSVTKAEDRLIAKLRSVDTVAEATAVAKNGPDVPTLVKEAEKREENPTQLAAWWRSLSRAEREALKMSHPELVGRLDGIPITDRDEANRANLSAEYNTLKQQEDDGELDDDGKDRIAKAREMYKALDAANDQTDSDDNPLQTYLMLYDPDAADGDGHAAVAFGNPETADHVSVNVPGLGSTMNNFSSVAGDAANVREASARQTDGSVASIAWLGYDAPDFSGSLDGVVDGLGVAGEGKADDGADQLSDFVDGLRESRPGDDRAHLTVIGHSYGSVATGKAAADGMDADDVVLVGSPGVGEGNDKASDLTGNVYVGSSDEDFVTRLGTYHHLSLGVDPASEDFGATRFRVDPQGEFNINPDGFKRGIENHTSYFDSATEMHDEGRGDHDSESLKNIAKVVSGHGQDVETVGGRTESNDAWWIKQGASDAKDGLWNYIKSRTWIG